VNKRRPVRALAGDDVRTLEHLWYVSNRRGWPLNTLVTVRIDGFDDLAPAEKATAYRRILDNMGESARRRDFPIYNLWVREIARDNKGEHIHILAHIPRQELIKFRTCATSWLTSNQIDIAPASYKVSKAADGKKHSVLLYISKQMSPQACFRTAWRRAAGGVILGKRWGCSRSLCDEKKARMKRLKERRRANRIRFGPGHDRGCRASRGGAVPSSSPPSQS
jgi:hypothetical protein